KAVSVAAKVETLLIPASLSPDLVLLILDRGSLCGGVFSCYQRPHGDADLPIADMRITRMAHHHVVHADHVALLPLEADGALFVNLAYVLHHRIWNLRAVAVVNVAGQIFALEDREQGFACLFVQAVHVMQLNLVEENLLARLWVTGDSLAILRNPQAIVFGPLAGHT